MDLLRLARRRDLVRALGFAVFDAPPLELHGRLYPQFRARIDDNRGAMRLFNALAIDDAQHDPIIRAMGRRFRHLAEREPRGGVTVDRAIARRIHAFVRQLRFQAEEEETSRAPGLTFALRAGDCDDHAYAVVSYALAAGLPARMAPLLNSLGEISHTVPVIDIDGEPTWAETTVAARLGEHPFAAANRVAAGRTDITG